MGTIWRRALSNELLHLLINLHNQIG
jgi:hypothetical protein